LKPSPSKGTFEMLVGCCAGTGVLGVSVLASEVFILKVVD
jgi:hypothetical protein